MPNSTSRTVSFAGRRITYLLERKKVKNLNLRIRPDGSVHVSAHPLVPVAQVDAFVESKGVFVLQALESVARRQERKELPRQYADGETIRLLGSDVTLRVVRDNRDWVEEPGGEVVLHLRQPEDFTARQRVMHRFRDEKCSRVFTDLARSLWPAFAAMGLREPALRMRDMVSRWGSCMARKGVVTLNKRLLEAPLPCIEYVMIHEYCHLVHQDHSPRFYALLASLMPDWKDRRALLNQDAERWR